MKGQGLPVRMIVVIAILVVTLILVLAFTGNLPRFFQKIPAISPDDLDTAKVECSTACASAKASVRTEESWYTSSYCRKRVYLDLNRDGTISEDEEFGCYDNEVGSFCQVTVDGKTLSTCEAGEVTERGFCQEKPGAINYCDIRKASENVCENGGCEFSETGFIIKTKNCEPPACTNFNEAECTSALRQNVCEWVIA